MDGAQKRKEEKTGGAPPHRDATKGAEETEEKGEEYPRERR